MCNWRLNYQRRGIPQKTFENRYNTLIQTRIKEHLNIHIQVNSLSTIVLKDVLRKTLLHLETTR